MLTERENFIAYNHGEKAEWIPNYGAAVQYVGIPILEDPTDQMLAWMAEHDNQMPEDFRAKDCFGVAWRVTEEGAVPDATDTLLDDVTRWREVVTFPETEGYDWDAACAQSEEWLDPAKVNLIFMVGPFMQLIDSMGHTNGFVSLLTESDEVKAYMARYNEFLIELIDNVMTRQKIDYFILADDMATAMNLFISPDTYREFFKPLHKQIIDEVKKVSPDTFIEFHLCGHCDDLLEDIVDLGVESWQPAQVMNDLDGFAKKHPGFGITGGWDAIKALTDKDMTEEDVRKSVRDTFDEFASDGEHYMFFDGATMGSDPIVVERTAWANDEAAKYGRELYQKVKG